MEEGVPDPLHDKTRPATKGEVRSKAGLARRRSPSGELRD
jgi:hypothetical protein